ncbi:MAG TPA: DUF4124 domain-containing protein [Casimicrobiaceae bacterium]|nr:DUF4124 domain-containing protein [Casimicrobiaceae bacterium]
MMPRPFLHAALSATVLLALGLSPAHADIYTWVDASGTTNVSNLAPPDDVTVTKIQRALPPEIVAREDAARDAARKAEADAAAARIRQLESQLAHSPPPDYVVPAPAPVIQYIVEAPQPPMQQSVEITSPAYGGYGYAGYGYAGYGCDPSWFGCWWPGFYPASVIVVGPSNPHNHPIQHGHGVTGPRLPPPFGPPLVPNFGPQPKMQLPMRSPMRAVNAPFGMRRG